MTSLAYIDDTQWLTDSQTKLEEILKIADSFYNLNDIQVNKEKSELLIKKKKIRNETFSYNEKIKIIFGNAQIEIKPKHPSESIRILGVWFNAKNNQNFVVGQAKEEIWNLSNLMRNKRITDKHLLYILNKLIIPRIEYWTQTTVLSKQQNEKIIKPFRKIFKNKLRMAITAPNAILNNPFIYNYRNLEEIQKQAKITNFLVQINDRKQLGKITKLRLRNLQKKEWLAKGLLEHFPFDKKPRKYKNNFIFNNLLLCKENDITFEISEETKTNIEGGKITLHKILGKDYNKFKYQLRKDSIIFLEQILTIDKTELLTWKEIKKKIKTTKSIKPTNWYKKIKEKITIDNNNLRLKNEYNYVNNGIWEFKEIDNFRPSTFRKYSNKPFLAYYNFNINSTIIGKLQ